MAEQHDRAAATRLGVPLEAYRAHLAAGRKWCSGCRRWRCRHEFNADRSRADGLQARCKPCHSGAVVACQRRARQVGRVVANG